jgi:hypothetical protein
VVIQRLSEVTLSNCTVFDVNHRARLWTWEQSVPILRHDEVGTWLRAGAVAVGLGSDLVPAVPSETELDAIAQRARRVAKQITQTRA